MKTYKWHTNKNIIRNEKIKSEQLKIEGYFSFFNHKWVFVNENLTLLKDVTEEKEIPIGSFVELTNGKRLLLSKENGGRVVIVSITNK